MARMPGTTVGVEHADPDPGPHSPGDDGSTEGARRSPLPRRLRVGAPTRRETILFLGLLLCYGFFQQTASWNENSRYDLVRAIVEDGTTRIDRFEQNTGDKAFYDGHFYSDKPPGSALIGVPVYALLTTVSQATTGGPPDPATAVQALAFVEGGVFTALLVLLLLRFLRPAVGDAWALVVSIGYGLGSIAFPFATMFFGHAASAVFLFAAFYHLWRWRTDSRAWRPIAAGVLAGCAVITELPVVLGVAVLCGYALWVGRSRALLFVLGGLPLAAVLAVYGLVSFGSPIAIGYQYATVFGNQNRQGIVSIVLPSPATALDLLMDPRGLLRLAPWFCVAPLGLLAYRRRVLRPEVVVSTVMCVVFLVYNSGALNPFGGWTPGPRYLLPALPFAAILVALAPTSVRPLTAGLIAIGIMAMFVATVTMPNAPERYEDPLYLLWLPRLLAGDLAQTIAWSRWGMSGSQPLVVLGVALAGAAAALVATFRRGAGARRFSDAIAIGLAVLLLLFAQPFLPPATVAIGSSAGRPVGSISIDWVGATRELTDEGSQWRIATQLANHGPAIKGSRVVFSALDPEGKTTWSAWYGEVAWGAGEQKRVVIAWDAADAAPSRYRVGVRVLSADGDALYAASDGAAEIRIP
jgi:hypothetical protein